MKLSFLFPRIPSHVFVPSLTRFLSLSVVCSRELVPFISPFCFPRPSVSAFCLLLLPFLLSAPSTQERSSSLLARACHESTHSHCFALYHTHEKHRASQAMMSTKYHKHACESTRWVTKQCMDGGNMERNPSHLRDDRTATGLKVRPMG